MSDKPSSRDWDIPAPNYIRNGEPHPQPQSQHPPDPPEYLSPTDPALYALPSPYPIDPANIYCPYNPFSALRVLRYFCQVRSHPAPALLDSFAPCTVKVLLDDIQNNELVFIISFGLLVHIKEKRKENGERQAFMKRLSLYGNVGDIDEDAPGGKSSWRRQWEEIQNEVGFMEEFMEEPMDPFGFFGDGVLGAEWGFKTLSIKHYEEYDYGEIRVTGEERSEKVVYPATPGTEEQAGLQSYCPNTFRHFLSWLGWWREFSDLKYERRTDRTRWSTLVEDSIDGNDEESQPPSPTFEEDAFAMWIIEGVLLSAAMVLEEKEVVEKVLFTVDDGSTFPFLFFDKMEIRSVDPGLGVIRFLQSMDSHLFLHEEWPKLREYNMLVDDGERRTVDGLAVDNELGRYYPQAVVAGREICC